MSDFYIVTRVECYAALQLIYKYNRYGQIVEIYTKDDLVDNYFEALEVKKSGDWERAAKMFELSTKPTDSL